MSKLELGSLIHQALRHVLQEQQKLLKHPCVTEFVPVIQRLVEFTLELEDWYSDKFHLKDRASYFLGEAEKIEAEADRISEELWRYAPLSLIPIFQKIVDIRTELAKEKSFARQLRPQYNNFRLGLLEQVAGARLLQNNSDLGEEVERIFAQYLERRLGSSVRILRGGHIYDYKDNRSGQIDIIITPADAMGFCPADTAGGKYNVLVDQVLAAISITSRLTVDRFQTRWKSLQQIPVFEEKEKAYPQLKGHAWPLCYIVGAESDDVEKLAAAWDEVAFSDDRHPPQMVILLDSGHMMAGTACWPRPKFGCGPNHPPHIGTGIDAGLGLGWLELQITGRNSVLTHRSLDWVQRMSEQLEQLEINPGTPPTYDPRRHYSLVCPIHGVLSWGGETRFVHNRLDVAPIFIDNLPLLDSTKPIPRETYYGRYEFEPRWFRFGAPVINGHCCAFEEWFNPTDREKHSQRVAVFDSRTGEEVTWKLTRAISNCSELSGLDPVLKE